MQRSLGTTAAMLAWVSSALALRLDVSQDNYTPGVHVQNLAGESFELNQLGDHSLLRAPPDANQSALIRLSGHFSANPQAPCALYTDAVTIMGEWLGNQTLRLSVRNRSLHIKVFSSSPAYAGPWRSIQNYTPAKDGHEAIPDSFKITTAPDNTGLTFYVGHGQPFSERPTIKVKRAHRAGIDVALSKLQGFEMQKLGGLLGSYKHNKMVEEISSACEAVPAGTRKAISATVDHVESRIALQSTHLRNLAHEKFTIHQPGVFVLLRVPRAQALPALISVRGSFVPSSDDMCVVFLQRLTLLGNWFGNKTVHVSSMDGTLNIKVSSPEVAGKVRSVSSFIERNKGPEALPRTVKVTSLSDGPSFKFQLGSKRLSERANILVTLTQHGGLDIKAVHMERIVEGEIGGLLGMDNHGKAIVTPSKDCKGQVPQVDVPKVDAPGELSTGAGSLLTASWDA